MTIVKQVLLFTFSFGNLFYIRGVMRVSLHKRCRYIILMIYIFVLIFYISSFTHQFPSHCLCSFHIVNSIVCLLAAILQENSISIQDGVAELRRFTQTTGLSQGDNNLSPQVFSIQLSVYDSLMTCDILSFDLLYNNQYGLLWINNNQHGFNKREMGNIANLFWLINLISQG